MEEASNVSGEENYVEDGGNGKKRKYCGAGSSSAPEILKEENSSLLFSSLFKSYSSSSKNGKRTLKILNQPEQQHRARYQTEGSRGSVKDREGSGFPTIQFKGYHGPEKKLRLQVFIGSDQGRPVLPHVYYQACKVAGKNSTPSQEWRQEGTDIILMDMEVDKDFIVRCDCVGILKERYSDIESKIPAQKQRTNWKKKSTKCRMVFRIEFEEEDGSKETLQVVSDPISCSQQPGTPEILKMSTDISSLPGGGELWMIGKNFLKDAVVVFLENLPNSEALHRAPWRQIIHPDKDFFNNSHMIVTIPPYTLGPGVENRSSCPIDVSVFVKCGEKTSDSHSFTYRLKETTKDHNSSTSSSPKSFSPIRSNRSNPSSRITILEPVETRYMTKEEIDYCEDTVFDPEKTQEDVKGSYVYHRKSIQEESNSVSFSNITNHNNNNNTDEELKSDRLTTFSNLFQKEKPSNNVSHSIGDSSLGVMVIPKISSDTLKAAQKELLKNVGDVAVESKIMVNGNSNGTLTNPTQEFLGTNIESKSATNGPIYIQGTESDNATISIKLPNSIISNSEKFENVMNTINKALLQPDPTLKSIDSNLARVNISRNSNTTNNNSTTTPSAPVPEQVPSQTTQVAPAPLTPAAPTPLVAVASEPPELNPKKQKINEQVITSQPSSNWLETWNTSTTTTAPIAKEAPKGHTPMDTTPFFTTQAPPEPSSTWSEQPPPQEKSQISLSNIIPELKSNPAAAVSENWNSVKVEAENWSKSAPTTWSSNVAATESWHTPATTVTVTQNWVAPSESNKNWSDNQVATSETWPNAATVVATDNIVISTAAIPPPVPEVVWQTKQNEATPNPVNEVPPASTNSWPEKAKEQVIVASANWSTDSKKETNGSEAPNWFNEPAKINNIWNEEWGSSGSSVNGAGGGTKPGEVQHHTPAPQWNVNEKPLTRDHSITSTWSADSTSTNDQNTPTQQNWVPEAGKLGAWNNQVGEGNGATNGLTDKKGIGEIVVAPFISQEMTPIDPKKVMYDPSPMEVDGVFNKSKMDYKASEINSNSGSIKGNPLLSESSGIISQQQKIESAIIGPGKVSEYQPIKYQPTTEGLYQLFSNTPAPEVQK
ncbi:uncharacterized protein NFAT [Lepeophtheirus salmonis]|uniref:uncharacterized protein NFAT n=1 Tax=Lepeophtheirus salmonis TaxID=72036 RepID=UPI001AEB8A57|nr:nuclear factor of activated T-cells 5-like [Lepeophtheirus salmonis]